jgi:chromosomal replication initiator protein
MVPLELDDPRSLARAWQAILGRLEFEVSTHNFATWLRGTRALRLEHDTLVVQAAASYGCDWLNQRLVTVVERATEDMTGRPLRVVFVPRGQLEAEAEPAEAARRSAAAPAPPTAPAVVGSLNTAFTFDRYVPGEGNFLAHRACAALFDDEGAAAISPVVIWGAPGMGKTHLLHAVASAAVARGWPVACLSAEQFTSRYQGALRRQEVERFQAELRAVRLLVLDDLQYLEGKKATAEEFVHTVDAISMAGGHVVIASERHPGDLDFPGRLQSRLTAGLVTRVQPFLADERRRYVEQLAVELRVGLPGAVVDRLAGIEAPSVRVLQGAVHGAVALARCGRLDLRRLDAELCRLTASEAAGRPLDAGALEAIARHFGTTPADVIGRSRKAPVAEARALAVVALRDRGLSLAAVGEALGGRDRSTISQLEARGRTLLESSPALRALLSA